MRRLLLLLILILGSCTTPVQHVIPIDYKPVAISLAVKHTGDSFNSALNSSKVALDDANKLIKAINTAQQSSIDKPAFNNIKSIAFESLFAIDKTFNTLDVDLKKDLFELQSKALILQNQISSLTTTVAKLDIERDNITKQNTIISTKLEDAVTSLSKWRLIGVSSISLILFVICLKVYTMFSGGGIVSSILSKIL